jgi:hypothetical protein
MTKQLRLAIAMCHGPDGKGQSAMGKQLNVKDWNDGNTH